MKSLALEPDPLAPTYLQERTCQIHPTHPLPTFPFPVLLHKTQYRGSNPCIDQGGKVLHMNATGNRVWPAIKAAEYLWCAQRGDVSAAGS
jgi:hypothetical protein